ncbi:hypothetical protein ROS59_003779 [Enterobacter cloacae]|nr:hypothetical protein [Enterobacter cloacae]
MINDKLEVPETGAGDHLHTTVKVALGAVPYLGGALAELFSSVIESPFQKRKHEWMKRVVEAIYDLQASGIKTDTLRDNEAFISAVFYASHLAMKTHQEEKLDALKNAIENVALDVEKDEVYQQVFLNYVDTLTVLHMRLLRFAKNPNPPSNMMMGSLESIFDKQNSDLNYNREFINQAWKELYNNGLIDVDSMSIHSSSGGLRQSRLTDLGKRFTIFITKKE